MKKNSNFTFTALLFLFFTTISAQSKIETIKETMKGYQHTHYGGTYYHQQKTNYSGGSQHSEPIGTNILELLFFSPKLILAISYMLLIETPREQDSPNSQATLLPYPFYNNHKGEYNIPLTLTSEPIKHLHRFEPQFTYFNEYGKLINYKGSFKWRFRSRFGFTASHSVYIERLASNKQTLKTSHLNIEYYRVRTKSVSFSYQIGLSYIHSGINSLGLLLGNHLEWFIKQPVSVFTTLRFHNHRFDNIFNTQIGISLHHLRYKLQTGYQHNNLAGIKTNAFFITAGLFL